MPPWLSVRHFTALLGGADAVHDYVLALHRKRQEWPDDLALETGWLIDGEDAAQRGTAARADGATRFVAPREALALVTKVTGAKLTALRTAAMGPGANPARRFAVWALKRQTTLTHEEIGRTLSMSPGQVAHVLRRLRLDAEPFKVWAARLDKGQVSSGGS